MVRKDILDGIGGFSSDFFLYFEETDLCARIKRNGGKIFNVPEAKIIHLESQSMMKDDNTINYFKLDNIEKSHLSYYKRNMTKTKMLFVLIIYRLFLLSRVFLLGIRKSGKKKEYQYRYSKFKEYFSSL